MSNSLNVSKVNTPTIADLFKTMDNSSVRFTHSNFALNWLKAHDCFLGFVDGNYIPKPTPLNENLKKISYSTDVIATFQIASSNELEAAAKNSLEGLKKWQQFDARAKSKVLYKIAQFLEQNSKLINGVENLTSLGRLKEKYNVPYLVESFRYYAGLVDDLEFYEGWKSLGVVGIVIEMNQKPTLISTLWRISSLLSAGNAVLILNCSESLSSFLLAELCHAAGLPPGLLNVLCYDGTPSTFLSKVNKVILSSSEHKQLISAASSLCVPCEILPYRRPCAILYESADLDAAADGVLEILLAGTEGVWPNCKVYLQESIQDKFIKLLGKKVCNTIDVVTSNRLPFFYIMANAILAEQLLRKLTQGISEEQAKGIYNICASVSSEYDKQCSHAVVISSILSSDKDQIQVGKNGPGIYIETFRSVKESIAMFNTDKQGLDASIWTEEICLALEVAHKLQTKTVWINSQNLFEPAVSYGSLYLSGHSVIGGKEGFFSQLSILEENKDGSNTNKCVEIQSYGAEAPVSNINLLGNKEKKIEKNMKLYIGGSFTNSSDDTNKIVFNAENRPYAYVASASKSDVQKSVLCASSAQPKWQKLSKLKRSAIVYKAHELLSKNEADFVSELCTITGCEKEICSKEVTKAINALMFWANYITHFDDNVTDTKLYGKVLQERFPIGVIGVQCPDQEPILSFASLITPAIIFGNSVVAIASEKYPTCAFKMCEIFQSAGLPSGVLNVLSNSRAYLTRHLASQLNIDALWFSTNGAPFIYNSNFDIQQKKIFSCKNMRYNLTANEKRNFVLQSTYSKAIYMLMGTDFTE